MREVVHLINLINHRMAVCFVFYKTSSRWERLNGFSRFMHCVQMENGPPSYPPKGKPPLTPPKEGDSIRTALPPPSLGGVRGVFSLSEGGRSLMNFAPEVHGLRLLSPWTSSLNSMERQRGGAVSLSLSDNAKLQIKV